MELIDNINCLLGDDLKEALKPGARLKVAASCFSMYSFEAHALGVTAVRLVEPILRFRLHNGACGAHALHKALISALLQVMLPFRMPPRGRQSRAAKGAPTLEGTTGLVIS